MIVDVHAHLVPPRFAEFIEQAAPYAVHIAQSSGERGDEDLIGMCGHFAEMPQQQKIICIFDRDNPKILKQLDQKAEKNLYTFQRSYSHSRR